MNALILYNYFRSSSSYRVRLALNLKGLSYTYQPVHLLNNGGEQNSPAYRKLNPTGSVPTLDHNGKIISQSMAIIEYLDEVFPQSPRLFPQEPFLKARVRQFCEIINADIQPLGNLKVLQFLETKLKANQLQKNQWLEHWVSDGLKACETLIQEFAASYSFGDEISAADLFLIPQLYNARRFEMQLDNFPLLLKIEQNLLKNPAFLKAHPHRQIDTPNDLKE